MDVARTAHSTLYQMMFLLMLFLKYIKFVTAQLRLIKSMACTSTSHYYDYWYTRNHVIFNWLEQIARRAAFNSKCKIIINAKTQNNRWWKGSKWMRYKNKARKKTGQRRTARHEYYVKAEHIIMDHSLPPFSLTSLFGKLQHVVTGDILLQLFGLLS